MMICRIIVGVSLDTAPRSTVPSLKGLAEMATRVCIKLHIPEPLACHDLRGKTPAIPRLPGGSVAERAVAVAGGAAVRLRARVHPPACIDIASGQNLTLESRRSGGDAID